MDYQFFDMSKFDLDYVLKKPKSAKAYFTYLLTRCIRMFEYKNLPDTIPADIFDRWLMTNGVVCIGKDMNDDLRVFFGNWGGEYDVYYRPSLFIVSNPHISNDSQSGWYHQYVVFPTSQSTKQDGVLMRNDTGWYGLAPMLSRYAALMAENILTIRTADVMLRIIALLSAPSDQEFKSAMEYIKALENGELKVVGDNPFFDGIKLQSPPSNNGSYLTQFIELHQYLKGSFYNEIGLSANYNMKREAIGKGESTLDNDSLLPLCENMLMCRREDFAKVNELFNTNIEVDFSSAWKENQVQRNIQLLSQLEQSSSMGAGFGGAMLGNVGSTEDNIDDTDDSNTNMDNDISKPSEHSGDSDAVDNSGRDAESDREENTERPGEIEEPERKGINGQTLVDLTMEKINEVVEDKIDDMLEGKENTDDTGRTAGNDDSGESEDQTDNPED